MARTKQAAVSSKKRALQAAKKPVAKGDEKAVKKPRRYRPGTVSLREIRKYQRSVEPVLPYAPFVRLVREVAQDFKSDVRFEKSALQALRVAAEAHATQTFQRANGIAVAGHTPSAAERKGGAANPTLTSAHVRIAKVWMREARDGLDDSGPYEFRDHARAVSTEAAAKPKGVTPRATPVENPANKPADKPAVVVEEEEEDEEEDAFKGSD